MVIQVLLTELQLQQQLFQLRLEAVVQEDRMVVEVLVQQMVQIQFFQQLHQQVVAVVEMVLVEDKTVVQVEEEMEDTHQVVHQVNVAEQEIHLQLVHLKVIMVEHLLVLVLVAVYI
jgi:hypothetical protein